MTLKNWAVLLIPARPPNPHDPQEKESSAKRLLGAEEICGKQRERDFAGRVAQPRAPRDEIGSRGGCRCRSRFVMPGSWAGRSAPGAVLAHGFVDQRIEFAARQRHVIARVFSAVTGDGQFRSAARRRRDKVTRTSRHQLGNFPAGEQHRLARHFRSQGDLRAVLDGLHSKERREKIRAAGYGAMIGKKERVVVRHERLARPAQLPCPRGGLLPPW